MALVFEQKVTFSTLKLLLFIYNRVRHIFFNLKQIDIVFQTFVNCNTDQVKKK